MLDLPANARVSDLVGAVTQLDERVAALEVAVAGIAGRATDETDRLREEIRRDRFLATLRGRR